MGDFTDNIVILMVCCQCAEMQKVTSKPSWFTFKPNAMGCSFSFSSSFTFYSQVNVTGLFFSIIYIHIYIYFFSMLSCKENLCIHVRHAMHTYDNCKVPGFWEVTLGNTGEESKCYLKHDNHHPAKHCDSLEEVGFSVCYNHSVGITGDTDPSG